MWIIFVFLKTGVKDMSSIKVCFEKIEERIKRLENARDSAGSGNPFIHDAIQVLRGERQALERKTGLCLADFTKDKTK